MILFSTEWQPWFSYGWWSDIGTGLFGVIAALIIGGATIWVASRSNAIADRTRDFQDLVVREEEARNERERVRELRLDRAALAGKMYEYVAKTRERALGREFDFREYPPLLVRNQIDEQATYLGLRDQAVAILDDVDRAFSSGVIDHELDLVTTARAAMTTARFEVRIQTWVREGVFPPDRPAG
ncbi:hypothetical protein ACIQUC_16260 [Curtobacterium sp. NPDC098951]|uniref:hypothetical protein n=1 Tax=Curtobacterium sp. NPDC098951 TaxID=3363974 RepID=UPI0038246D2B